MAMKAQIHTDSQGNIIVHMSGGLDYENSIPLRQELTDLSTKNPACTITLDMNALDFVGSSGIGIFVYLHLHRGIVLGAQALCLR